MFKKILVPVDVSVADDTQKLLRAAKSLTANWSCDRHVVTAIPNVGMPIVGSHFDQSFEAENVKRVEAELNSAISKSGIDAHQHVLSGTVYDCVISHAAKLGADLIIIGAHQPELSDYLLGSNASRVVRHSKQSVLVVRDIP